MSRIPKLLTALVIVMVIAILALAVYQSGIAVQQANTALQTCGEGWYHTMAALNEALIRLDGMP